MARQPSRRAGHRRGVRRTSTRKENRRRALALIRLWAAATEGAFDLDLGWGVGAVVGSGYDYRRAEKATGTVALVTRHMPPGGTAILAEVREDTPETLDLLAMRYDAVLERRPCDTVRTELKSMKEAAERIRREEAKERRDHKRAEAGRKFKDGVTQLKQKIAAWSAPRARGHTPRPRRAGRVKPDPPRRRMPRRRRQASTEEEWPSQLRTRLPRAGGLFEHPGPIDGRCPRHPSQP
ncbi:hypothetical protein [Streptomyces sp. NPDC057623]|uniref:hypothetical protein n=1 Tax=Streptomyces sp. NPDC057623 TaxID=3346187 RepID=UPI00368FA0BD